MVNYFRQWFVGVRINRVIEFLTFSDILMLSGWGLINPILAVFVTVQIKGGDVALAGFAMTVYFLVKSILQVPIARFVDSRPAERYDFWAMILGSLIISATAFLFIFASLPWHVIAIQALAGVGRAFSYPAWTAIFTRHIDKREEGLEWSLYYTATDLGAALTAGLGGVLAATFGYDLVFLIVGIASLAGTAFLTGVAHDLKKSKW